MIYFSSKMSAGLDSTALAINSLCFRLGINFPVVIKDNVDSWMPALFATCFCVNPRLSITNFNFVSAIFPPLKTKARNHAED
jgi:hypothetical protein